MTATIFLMSLYLTTTASAAKPTPADVSGPGARGDLQIAIKVEEGPFPIGASVPIHLTITNRTGSNYPLPMSGWGVPKLIEIVDNHGEPLPPARIFGQGVGSIGPGAPIPPEEIYALPNGQEVTFTIDAARVVQFNQQGQYAVRSIAPGVDPVSATFEVIAYDIIKELALHGGIVMPGGEAPGKVTGATARLRLVRGGGGRDGGRRVILIDSITTLLNPETTSALGTSLPVSTNAEIADAAMDYRGQVWIVLKQEGEWALILWRLHDRSFETLIPMGGKEVTIKTARQWPSLDGQFYVVAGTEDQLLTTSGINRAR